MKTAILQYYIGDGPLPEYVKISVAKFTQYAKLHGCDYIFDTKPKLNPTNPYFEHLRILYTPDFEKYDKVLYLDVDIIPEVMEENIFDEEIKDIGAIPESSQPGRIGPIGNDRPGKQQKYKMACAEFNIPTAVPTSVSSTMLMFNTGVLLWSKEGILKARDTFMDWPVWNKKFTGDKRFSNQMELDQTYSTGQIVQHLDYTELDYKWNSSPRIKFHEGKAPKNMNFVHYTSKKKDLIQELYSA